MITRLEVYGYRCFSSLSVDLDRYHVLAGANGAGKTTLLDIPVLMGDMLRRQRIVGAFLERQDGPFLDEEVVPRLLVTEEPENGIHPRAIETVVQSLSTLYDSQVWVSTHSPIVLGHTELPDILATRLGPDGSVSVVPGDQHPQLRDWQGTIDIGTLFAAGVLS